MNKYEKYFYEILNDMEYKDVNVDKILTRALYKFPNSDLQDLEEALQKVGIDIFYKDNKKKFSSKELKIGRRIVF